MLVAVAVGVGEAVAVGVINWSPIDNVFVGVIVDVAVPASVAVAGTGFPFAQEAKINTKTNARKRDALMWFCFIIIAFPFLPT
jgi:hypothetical protein